MSSGKGRQTYKAPKEYTGDYLRIKVTPEL